MALPKLESPKYEIKLPSLNRKIAYRPFLVKEEKILLVAMESQDQGQIVSSMKDLIRACTFDKVNPDELPIFELEYLFLKIRSKSVGEVVKLNFKCESCEKHNPQDVNLDEVQLETSQVNNKIKLNDKVGVVLRWPRVDTILELSMMSEEKQKESIIDVVLGCIVSIFDDKKVYPVEDQSREELIQFIESLSQAQFKMIQDYLEQMPKLSHTVKYECIHCKTENTFTIKGLQNFFS